MSSMRNLAARALRKAARMIDPVQPIIYLEDEYVTQLSYINAGILERGNLYSLDYAIGRLPSSAPMLEIGSYCGLSANLLTYFKRKHGVTSPLITCDKWELERSDSEHVGDSPVLFSDYNNPVRDSFLRNTRTFSGDNLPFTVEVFSDEFFSPGGNAGLSTMSSAAPLPSMDP